MPFAIFVAENAVKINQETITPKPVISTNFIGQTAKNPNEFVWNGESTILLVNFPDDKKYVLSSNPQATTTTMQNFLVPITTTSPNINAIVKKINLSTQIQQQQQQLQPPPPPPPPVSLHLTQIAAPKISSHAMNVNANKSLNVNKLQNMLGQQQQQQHQTLPNINGAITLVNSANHSLHNSPNQPSNNILLNNVSTTLPFNVQPSASIKKEYSLFDASSSSGTDSTMIPNDLLLSANAMDTMSPMQQSNCEDSCNSFDLFLSEAAQSHSDAAKMHDQHDKVSAMNVKKEPSSMVPSMGTSIDPCNVDLKTFDDLELMELMSQQLDMDISDDSCQPMTGIKDELIDR